MYGYILSDQDVHTIGLGFKTTFMDFKNAFL